MLSLRRCRTFTAERLAPLITSIPWWVDPMPCQRSIRRGTQNARKIRNRRRPWNSSNYRPNRGASWTLLLFPRVGSTRQAELRWTNRPLRNLRGAATIALLRRRSRCTGRLTLVRCGVPVPTWKRFFEKIHITQVASILSWSATPTYKRRCRTTSRTSRSRICSTCQRTCALFPATTKTLCFPSVCRSHRLKHGRQNPSLARNN